MTISLTITYIGDYVQLSTSILKILCNFREFSSPEEYIIPGHYIRTPVKKFEVLLEYFNKTLIRMDKFIKIYKKVIVHNKHDSNDLYLSLARLTYYNLVLHYDFPFIVVETSTCSSNFQYCMSIYYFANVEILHLCVVMRFNSNSRYVL